MAVMKRHMSSPMVLVFLLGLRDFFKKKMQNVISVVRWDDVPDVCVVLGTLVKEPDGQLYLVHSGVQGTQQQQQQHQQQHQQQLQPQPRQQQHQQQQPQPRQQQPQPHQQQQQHQQQQPQPRQQQPQPHQQQQQQQQHLLLQHQFLQQRRHRQRLQELRQQRLQEDRRRIAQRQQQQRQQQQQRMRPLPPGSTFHPCRVCDQSDGLIVCIGPCMRWFDPGCPAISGGDECQDCRAGYGDDLEGQRTHQVMVLPQRPQPPGPPAVGPAVPQVPPGPPAALPVAPGPPAVGPPAATVRRARRTADRTVAAQNQVVVATYQQRAGGGRVSLRARRQVQPYQS